MIAGAGTAGLTAAINLAKSGFDVEVYEKEKDVGCRFNGDFQGIENWSTKEDVFQSLKGMNIKINFLCVPYKNADFYSHDLGRYEVNLKKPLFYLIRRGNSEATLDKGLKEQALDNGVEIFFKRKIDPKKADIMATGSIKAWGIARGITFRTNIKDVAITILDDNIAPKGYAYLLVNNGEATLATVLFRGFKGIRDYFRKTLEKFKCIMDFEIADEREFVSHTNFFLRKSWKESGRLFAGERAGFQDALWGFGMRYAMVSGFLAAKSITEDKDYDSLIRENILNRMKTSVSNRFFFELLGNIGYKTFLKKGIKNGDPVGFLRKHYNPSLSKGITFPLAKLKFRKRI